MDIKSLTNEELIQLFEECNYSLQAIETKYSLGKNSVGRLFNKRGIDYKLIKQEKYNKIKEDYENNPKVCKFCGKPIPFQDRNTKDFCNHSCSASFNNKGVCRNGNPSEKHYCLNCGKETINKKFCSPICQQEYNYKIYINEWKQGLKDGMKGKYETSSYIRRYLFEKYNSSCQECGWNKVNPFTERIPLQIHHIDGDCTNNKEENLQLLCPNCHSLTENYGSLNQNSSRIYRKQKGNLSE